MDMSANVFWAVGGVVLLAACGPRSTVKPTRTTGAASVGLVSGVILANLDRSARPADDFYRFVNGRWLDTVEIPADKPDYGTFSMLYDEAQANLKAIVLEASSGDGAAGTDARKIGDAYSAFMDVEKIEALGLSPLTAEREAIRGLKTTEDLVRHMGHLSRIEVASPLAVYVDQDQRQPTSYILYVQQSGLGLPDRDYYFQQAEKFAAAREAYVAYVDKLLALAGHADTNATARRILALETALAHAQWTRVQSRDRLKSYNKRTPEELAELAPSLSWSGLFEGLGLDAVPTLVVRQPDYVAAAAEIIGQHPVALWRQYLEVKLLTAYAPRLPRAFVDLHFDFYGRTLKGIAENRVRWKRAVSETEGMLGEAIGKLYVERHFEPEAKARMMQLVENLRRAFEQSIDSSPWMTPPTRAAAQDKLAKFMPKIGYPDRWRDYSALEIRPDDAAGNAMRAARFEHARNMAKLGRPVDRSEWFMFPQTVNAYYNSSLNEIVFPAAILQPPFFDLAADDAINYGAIGAVIGHEMSHGFDDQGRRSDGDGVLRDWWTPEDAAAFKARAAVLVDQFQAYNPIDDLHVNGELTLGENIGDLSGLTIAYKAYRLALQGREAPVIDGFTGPQRFFIGWAQVWARKHRDDDLRRRLLTDPHSPARYRVVGVVSNMPEFYEAFGVEPGDKLFRPSEERARLW